MTIRLDGWKEWLKWALSVFFTSFIAAAGFAGGLLVTADRRFLALENDMRDRAAEIRTLRTDVDKKVDAREFELRLGFEQNETKRIEVRFDKLLERLRDKVGIFIP